MKTKNDLIDEIKAVKNLIKSNKGVHDDMISTVLTSVEDYISNNTDINEELKKFINTNKEYQNIINQIKKISNKELENLKDIKNIFMEMKNMTNDNSDEPKVNATKFEPCMALNEKDEGYKWNLFTVQLNCDYWHNIWNKKNKSIKIDFKGFEYFIFANEK